MSIESFSLNFAWMIIIFLLVLIGFGTVILILHNKENKNENGKSKAKKITLTVCIVLLLCSTVVAVILTFAKLYIEKQPADMTVSTRATGMLFDSQEYYKVNTTYGTKKKITESEFNELMKLYGEKEKGVSYLEGDAVINQYPGLYENIQKTLTNKSEYINARYIDGRIVYEVLDNSPKMTYNVCLYEYMPKTGKSKLLVKFKGTNIQDIAFIGGELSLPEDGERKATPIPSQAGNIIEATPSQSVP